jgi:hypothetical protein
VNAKFLWKSFPSLVLHNHTRTNKSGTASNPDFYPIGKNVQIMMEVPNALFGTQCTPRPYPL